MRYKRRNGEVIAFPQRTMTAQEVERYISKNHEIADYIALGVKQRRELTANHMAEDLGISVEDAERTLDSVAAGGHLNVTRSVIKGEKSYRAPARFVPESERVAQSQRAQKIGEEAAVRAEKVARYHPGDVVTVRDGRRRYAIAALNSNYGGEQTYYLVALSGAERGSVLSEVRESALTKDRDQTLAWSGTEGARLQSKFVSHAGGVGKGLLSKRQEAYSRAAEMVKAAGEPTIAPGVLLAQQVRAGFSNSLRGKYRGFKVSIAPGGKTRGVVYVTVGNWTKDSELLEKLYDAFNALNRVGLATHINSVQAYLGRFIITTEPAPAMNTQKVWEELAHVSKNAELRGNPRSSNPPNPVAFSRSTDVQTLLFPKDRFTAATARAWAERHDFRAAKVDAGSATATRLRVRQRDPGAFQKGSFRTITLDRTHGVEAVIGKPAGRARRNPSKPQIELRESQFHGEPVYSARLVDLPNRYIGGWSGRPMQTADQAVRQALRECDWPAIRERLAQVGYDVVTVRSK
jgi:hypothetical protein